MSEEKDEKKSYSAFFKKVDCGYVGIRNFGDEFGSFTVEELYQAFRARYEAEKREEEQEGKDDE